MTRHEFLRLLVSAPAAWLTGDFVSGPLVTANARALQTEDARLARVARVIEEYDAQGFHRTATAVDEKSGAWLADLAKVTGAEVAREMFPLARVDIRDAFVEAGGKRIEGVPLFDGTFTDARGAEGRLGPIGSDAEILLTSSDGAAIQSEGRSLEALRKGPHRALIVITRGVHPGLSLTNAAMFANPFGSPTLQVSSDTAAFLEQLATTRSTARVVADATRTATEGANVVASVTGTDSALAPVVVMTPRSGWWNCASERGGGLACWLESLRAVANSRPARSVLFVASSGHELGHFGLESFIQKRRELVKRAHAWVHLGANIGAARGVPRLQAADDEIAERASDALKRAGAVVSQQVPRGTVPAGEARNIHVGGGRYVSLLGSGPRFHSQADRWPDAVDAAAVARFASAIATLVVDLASSNG